MECAGTGLATHFLRSYSLLRMWFPLKTLRGVSPARMEGVPAFLFSCYPSHGENTLAHEIEALPTVALRVHVVACRSMGGEMRCLQLFLSQGKLPLSSFSLAGMIVRAWTPVSTDEGKEHRLVVCSSDSPEGGNEEGART